ncbi:MAG: TIGR04283 family arsenosugar biosynthesis glycosyltransferase [Polyangiales bacterium]
MHLSIIIPTWCEAEGIGQAVRAAREVAGDDGDEVLVVDAGSPDDTAAVAKEAGAVVLSSGKGRGVQLHRGACAATGDTLLFLHADARLPAEARAAMERALADREIEGGNFRLRFVPETRAARIFSVANDLRRRVLGVYYGDSAPFVRRDTYHRLGGFPPLPLFEDYVFLRRMESDVRTAYVRHPAVEASARRFAEAPLRTLALWGALQGLYSLGASPQRLAHLYRSRGNRSRGGS